MLNFVATSSAGPGNLQTWPVGGAVPTASTLNSGSVTGLASIANGLAIPIATRAWPFPPRDFTVKANNTNTHAGRRGRVLKAASDVSRGLPRC
jgi:hypothetical protein